MTAARLRELLLVRPSRRLLIDSTMTLLTTAAMFMTGSRGGRPRFAGGDGAGVPLLLPP